MEISNSPPLPFLKELRGVTSEVRVTLDNGWPHHGTHICRLDLNCMDPYLLRVYSTGNKPMCCKSTMINGLAVPMEVCKRSFSLQKFRVIFDFFNSKIPDFTNLFLLDKANMGACLSEPIGWDRLKNLRRRRR
jgi:hypothetical protein